MGETVRTALLSSQDRPLAALIVFRAHQDSLKGDGPSQILTWRVNGDRRRRGEPVRSLKMFTSLSHQSCSIVRNGLAIAKARSYWLKDVCAHRRERQQGTVLQVIRGPSRMASQRDPGRGASVRDFFLRCWRCSSSWPVDPCSHSHHRCASDARSRKSITNNGGCGNFPWDATCVAPSLTYARPRPLAMPSRS